MTLTELRVWHWKSVLASRKRARKCETDEKIAQKGLIWCKIRSKHFHKQADFHLGAVQALNDILSGTAEGDLYLTTMEKK